MAWFGLFAAVVSPVCGFVTNFPLSLLLRVVLKSCACPTAWLELLSVVVSPVCGFVTNCPLSLLFRVVLKSCACPMAWFGLFAAVVSPVCGFVTNCPLSLLLRVVLKSCACPMAWLELLSVVVSPVCGFVTNCPLSLLFRVVLKSCASAFDGFVNENSYTPFSKFFSSKLPCSSVTIVISCPPDFFLPFTIIPPVELPELTIEICAPWRLLRVVLKSSCTLTRWALAILSRAESFVFAEIWFFILLRDVLMFAFAGSPPNGIVIPAFNPIVLNLWIVSVVSFWPASICFKS